MEELEELVKTRMDCTKTAFDASHDYLHVFRVRDMALKLVQADASNVDTKLVEIATLLHDFNDHKYETSTPLDEDPQVLQALERLDIKKDQRALLFKVVANVSYSHEKRLRSEGRWTSWHDNCKELH